MQWRRGANIVAAAAARERARRQMIARRQASIARSSARARARNRPTAPFTCSARSARSPIVFRMRPLALKRDRYRMSGVARSPPPSGSGLSSERGCALCRASRLAAAAAAATARASSSGADCRMRGAARRDSAAAAPIAAALNGVAAIGERSLSAASANCAFNYVQAENRAHLRLATNFAFAHVGQKTRARACNSRVHTRVFTSTVYEHSASIYSLSRSSLARFLWLAIDEHANVNQKIQAAYIFKENCKKSVLLLKSRNMKLITK